LWTELKKELCSSAKGEGSPSLWKVNSASKNRVTEKKAMVASRKASEGCSLLL